jgi:hypothetical protein
MRGEVTILVDMIDGRETGIMIHILIIIEKDDIGKGLALFETLGIL